MTLPKCTPKQHRQITPVFIVDFIHILFATIKLSSSSLSLTVDDNVVVHKVKLCLISAHFTDEKAAIERN